MEDQFNRAHVESRFSDPAPPPPPQEAVFFDATTESVTLNKAVNLQEDDNSDMKQIYSDNDTTDAEGESEKYSTVLLSGKSKKRTCCSFCPSYRSADPDRAITPFAVVLLAVLFAVYILNQADRLVLPVAIPAGLRCEVSIKNECRNLTQWEGSTGYVSEVELNFSNTSNATEDCIHFSDYEQGLLTGGCLILRVLVFL